MTSNMKLLLAASSAKSFVSAEEKKRDGGAGEAVITSMHKFIFPHRWNPWKLKLHATCLWGNPISGGFQLSQYPRMRWRLTRFCFVSPWRPPPLSLHRGVFVCHSTFSRWVRCDLSSVSVIHSTPTPPSLPLDSFHHLSEWESGVTVMWWGYADCQDGLLPWETRPHTCTHNGCVTHKHTGRITRACIHPYSQHTIAHMHDCTIADSAAHMHGPVNSWACQPKVAQSDTVFQLETGQGRHHASAASTLTWNAHTHLSYFLPFTHTYLSTLV